MGIRGKKYWASWAKWWKRGGSGEVEARVPPSPNKIGLGEGARPPFPSPSPSLSSLSFLPPFLDSYSYYLEGGGILLPVGVGLLLGAPSLAGRPLPLGSFIYGGRGAPHDTQVDLRIVP